jgi:uncharacterized membrane protein YkoI
MKIMFLSLVLVAGISPSLYADDINREEILSLVNQGKIQSLETILKRYPEDRYGKLLDLEVDRKHGRLEYELVFLHRDGTVIELKIDATNGKILKQKVKD